MSAVLGIDAAWTDRHDSGVALVVRRQESWRCLALASSYADFLGLKRREIDERARVLDAGKILNVAKRKLQGEKIQVIAVDMPLSTSPIERRRVADDLISRKFGKFGCSTHSPTAERPGSVADDARNAFEEHDYLLQTSNTMPLAERALIEVYPHPAILVLCECDYRVPYKVQNTGRYWPDKPVAYRKKKVIGEMKRIRLGIEG